MCMSKNVLASDDVENNESRVGCMSFPKLVIEDEEVFSLFYKAFLKGIG